MRNKWNDGLSSVVVRGAGGEGARWCVRGGTGRCCTGRVRVPAVNVKLVDIT